MAPVAFLVTDDILIQAGRAQAHNISVGEERVLVTPLGKERTFHGVSLFQAFLCLFPTNEP